MTGDLGLYFSQRDPGAGLGGLMGWAVTATTLGCAMELPFDRAKHAMTGGNRGFALASTALRIPLGSMLLVGYDKIRTAQERKAGEARRGAAPSSL